jgi:hypothetical protein
MSRSDISYFKSNGRKVMEPEDFNVKVLEVIENDDGSATLVLDMDSKAAQAFLSLGVLRAIQLGLDATEEEQ